MSHGIGHQSADPSATASFTGRAYMLGTGDDDAVGESFSSAANTAGKPAAAIVAFQ